MKVYKILFVRLRFILVFIAVALIVAGWPWIMNVVEKVTRPKGEASGPSEYEYYCPMDPQVSAEKPGMCPICHMALSGPRKKGEKAVLPPGVTARLTVSPFKIQQAGIASVEVRYRALVRDLRTVGFIEWDERKFAHLSARIAGRADELFINFTGVRVKQGDPVYRLYSPELVTTQEEYLLAIKTLEEILNATPRNEASLERARRLVDSTRERLKLWGITEAQIDEIAKSKKAQTHLIIYSPISGVVVKKDIHAGHYVQVGEDPYTIVDDSIVWMMAEVFERDLGLVKEAEIVEMTSEAYPGETFTGRIGFIQPSLQTDTRTVKVRVDVPNRELKLKAGMVVSASIRIPLGRHGRVLYVC